MAQTINTFLDISLLLLLVAVTLLIVRSNNNLTTIILSSLFSLVLCTLFIVMDAVDVAFTEAAVGAGISGILFLLTIKRVQQANLPQKNSHKWPSGFAILIAVVLAVLLIFGTFDMPFYGDPNTPVQQYLTPRFLYQSQIEIDIPNTVTAVLASYRGYDTFGEVIVVFIAGIAVFLLLKSDNDTTNIATSDTHSVETQLITRSIFRTTLVRIIPLILLFSLYVQFHGDYGPGGGFQAGVIFGVALITYGLLTTQKDFSAIVSPSWINTFAALGGLIYGGVGVVTLLMGGEFLNYNALNSSATTGQHIGILIIELGVGITVAFTMLSLFTNFNNHLSNSN